MRVSGGMRISREYVARDPRTGKPINMGGRKNINHVIETESGPWMAIRKEDIIPLAKGEKKHVDVSWKGKNLQLGQIDGIIALTRIKGKGKNASLAHSTLLSVSYTHLRAHET